MPVCVPCAGLTERIRSGCARCGTLWGWGVRHHGFTVRSGLRPCVASSSNAGTLRSAMVPSLPRMRSVRLALALVTLVAVVTGCRPPYEAKHDAIPDPVGTLELVAAAMDESTPLSPAEWAVVDAALDAHRAEYDQLRVTVIAPYAREVREDPGRRWLADEAALARFDRKAQMVAMRIRTVDDALFERIASALPERKGFVERASARRAIDRAERISRGSAAAGTEEGVLDLDVEIGALLARPQFAAQAAELRATLEPLRASYRGELAVACDRMAEALLEFPSDRLRTLRAAGVDPEAISTYVRGGGSGRTDDERQAITEAVRRASHRMVRAQIALDDLNARAIEAWTPLLPPEAAEALRSESAYRRVPPQGGQPVARWYVEVVEALPEVRSGAAPRTLAAARAARAAMDEHARFYLAFWRASTDDRSGTAAQGPSSMDAERLNRLAKEADAAAQSAATIGESELRPETLEQLRSLMAASAADARATLEHVVGRANAARLIARAPRSMFQPRHEDEPQPDNNRSFALQLFLGPLAAKADFERIAATLGAKPGDAIVAELWERYVERSQALDMEQEEALRAQEKRIMELGNDAERDSAPFERAISEYVRALMTADEARSALMLGTLDDLAAGRGVSSEDPRVQVARAQLAVARATVPWKRFQTPWLLGPLWLAQADVLMLAAVEVPQDPVSVSAALAVATRHASTLESAALHARTVGFDALREFLFLILQLQRRGRAEDFVPEDIPGLPAAQALARRTREAGVARAEAQIAFMADMAPVLGIERSNRLRAAYVQAAFPEFFAEQPWHAAARDVAGATAAGRSGHGTAAGATDMAEAAERWQEANNELMGRLLVWTSAPGSVPPPLRPEQLPSTALEDPELGALRALRDESSLRLLRSAAVAAGEAPSWRMPGAIRMISRPPITIQP